MCFQKIVNNHNQHISAWACCDEEKSCECVRLKLMLARTLQIQSKIVRSTALHKGRLSRLSLECYVKFEFSFNGNEREKRILMEK